LKKIKFSQVLSQEKTPKVFNDLCDQFFNFNYQQTEKSIPKNNQSIETYEGERLDEQALNTSWFDYYQMINFLERENLTMLDLGASYAKGSLLSSLLGKNNIYSIEIVKERIDHAKEMAQKLKLNKNLFICDDATQFNMAPFDIVFLYQPVGKLLNTLLNRISETESLMKVWLVESHGDLINRVTFDNRFTDKVILFQLSSKRHDMNFYQFKNENQKKRQELTFEDKFYQAEFVEVQSTNPILGVFNWLTTSKKSYIDYLEETPTINLNGRRFKLNCAHDKIVNFSPKLTVFQKKYINKDIILYKEKEQKILKVISAPEEGLELSSNGFISKECLLD